MTGKPCRRSLMKMQAACDAFNAEFPVGSPVHAYPGTLDDQGVDVEIRYPATVLSGHTAVAWVTGGHGCVALTHIRRRTHCWEDGPRTDDDCGQTCMLPAGHTGPHEWTRDDAIVLDFDRGKAAP
jgi:hypothetical protein